MKNSYKSMKREELEKVYKTNHKLAVQYYEKCMGLKDKSRDITKLTSEGLIELIELDESFMKASENLRKKLK